MAPIPEVTAAIDQALTSLVRGAYLAHKSQRVSH
jgi:hypothetical protein